MTIIRCRLFFVYWCFNRVSVEIIKRGCLLLHNWCKHLIFAKIKMINQNSMRIKALIAAIALSAMTINATVYELPVTNIEGKEYYYYEVKSSETLYSLSHKLELSQEEMIKYNPSLANGLKSGMKLYFPISELGKAGEMKKHKVSKGETLYSISKKYHISIEQLLQLNPSAQNGLTEGEELVIKTNADASKFQAKNNGALHTIVNGETLYSIAVQYNTTVDDLLAMNPGLSIDAYNVGTVIRVKNTAPLISNFKGESSVNSQSFAYNPRVSYIDNESDVNIGLTDTAVSEINIAILMPFMLNQKSVDKKTRTNLDFYKGFIVAADSLKRNGVKVKIYAYDTYANVDSVKNVLSRPEIAKMNVIVTPPSDKETIALVAELSDTTNVYAFNVFAANDTTHYNHSRVLQANIVRDNMYDKAAETLVAQYGDYTPVIVGSEDDKGRADLVELIKNKYAAKGKQAVEIIYEKSLAEADLSQLDKSVKYIFIPLSQKEASMDRYFPAIKAYKKDLAEGMTVLFGYPEWVLLKDAHLKDVHSLNTVIYSRFYYNDESERCKAFENKFKAMFKKDIISSTPIQAAIGFDTGYYLIKSLRKGNGNILDSNLKYEGLQNGFKFEKNEDNAGPENKSLFFILFHPDGSIERIMY